MVASKDESAAKETAGRARREARRGKREKDMLHFRRC